jgi:hypothetical protein
MLLRFFENAGRLRRAISVVKKRVGPHEETIREFKISATGVAVGEPLEQFRSILMGSTSAAITARAPTTKPAKSSQAEKSAHIISAVRQ